MHVAIFGHVYAEFRASVGRSKTNIAFVQVALFLCGGGGSGEGWGELKGVLCIKNPMSKAQLRTISDGNVRVRVLCSTI